jgi:hypothetical protein
VYGLITLTLQGINMKKFHNEYQIQRWCLKYYVLPTDLGEFNHVSELPYPDNFISISTWSYTKARKIKKEMEDAYRTGYLNRAHEEFSQKG